MKHEHAPHPSPQHDDMARFRKSLKHYCECKHGDFDTVNLITTLRRTVSELTNMLEAYGGDPRVTPGRINVLMTLDSTEDKRMPLSELGDYLVVTRANITGLVDGLVKDGLVRRIDHPEDRRVVLAELTERGKRFIAWFAPRHHELINKIGNCISNVEKRRIVESLDELRARIRSLPIPPSEPFRE